MLGTLPPAPAFPVAPVVPVAPAAPVVPVAPACDMFLAWIRVDRLGTTTTTVDSAESVSDSVIVSESELDSVPDINCRLSLFYSRQP